jgi:hypothetical protein
MANGRDRTAETKKASLSLAFFLFRSQLAEVI